MRRYQLFEFEDLHWFPDWVRQHMTLFIVAVHRALDTPSMIAPLVARALRTTRHRAIVDLCSGGSGPMIELTRRLKAKPGMQDLSVTLTDLYPNRTAADAVNTLGVPGLRYDLEPVDAGNVAADHAGVRTMICSMHHMPPPVARRIVADAHAKRQPLCVFEISDNSAPIQLWWLALPFAFLMTLALTPMIRPMTWKQLVFTYVIPILPILVAWDGAASNARTYSQDDMRELVQGLDAPDYEWEIGVLKKDGYPGGMAYMLGLPRGAA